jgi:hypothetical protein
LGERTIRGVSRGQTRGQTAEFRQKTPEFRVSPRFAESCLRTEFPVNCFFQVQEPRSVIGTQGIRYLLQTFGVAGVTETIPVFIDRNRVALRRSGLAGNVFVTIQNNLRAKRRRAAHANRNMSPVCVHDVEK